MSLTGSCLCGAVRYEVDRLDGPIVHCHCVTCRKAHAAGHTTTAGVLRTEFHWLAGEASLSAHESSAGKLHRFCSLCGTHVVAERPGQPHVTLRVATLDTDPGGRPEFHIWTTHDPAWLVDDADVPRYAEWQPGR